MELWKYIVRVIWKLPAEKLGFEFSLRFLKPCLNTSFALANLEGAGNFDEPIHCMKSVWTQTLIGQYFPVFSLTTGKLWPKKVRIWTLLKGSALLIWRHDVFKKAIFYQLTRSRILKSVEKKLLIIMLGWILYLSIASNIWRLDKLCRSLCSA